MDSLCPLEPSNQYSISFGNNSIRAYLQAPHSTAYSFPNRGSFTIEFLVNIHDSVAGTFPIFSKPDVFEVSFYRAHYYSQLITSCFRISHPGGNWDVGYVNYGNTWQEGDITDKLMHFIFVWNVTNLTQNTYRGVATLYLNSVIAQTESYTYYNTYPNTDVDVPINICGDGAGPYWSSNTITIDQIAVYGKALTVDEVFTNFKKCVSYETVLKDQNVSTIWPFNDTNPQSSTINAYEGGSNGTYYGGYAKCTTNYPGPSTLVNALSCYFSGGGQAALPIGGGSTFTYEWWFKTTDSKRSVLFSAQDNEYPFNGPLVQINSKDFNYNYGTIQFSMSDNQASLHSRSSIGETYYSFNDGEWHHIAITHNSSSTRLYLDGILHESRVLSNQNSQSTGYLMNASPGHINTDGFVSYFASYNLILPDYAIRQHASYGVRYKIKGIVTLLGIPYRATLRFYSSYTGELVSEVQSDTDSGEYSVTLYNNEKIDIMVFDPTDLSVKYRAYGPVTPSEIEDLPINI
jgi:hypothetical protein